MNLSWDWFNKNYTSYRYTYFTSIADDIEKIDRTF